MRWRAPFVFVISVALVVGSFIAPVSATPYRASMVAGTAQESLKFVGARVCPTKKFWFGAGWGADRGRRTHMGVDLGGKRGTPIYAIEKGRIDRTKKQSNGALQIVLKGKSGSKYYYGHMDKVLVKSGQRVKKGQMIARMGDTGSPGQVHLHFEYWKSGRESDAINPIKLLRRICSRR